MIQSKLPKVGTTIFTVMSQLAQEHGAVNLGQGFPDFPVPSRLVEELDRAMREGHNQYAPMTGVPALRQAIADKTARVYGHRPDADAEVTVTSGATEAIFNAVHAVVRAGDDEGNAGFGELFREGVVDHAAKHDDTGNRRVGGVTPCFVRLHARLLQAGGDVVMFEHAVNAAPDRALEFAHAGDVVVARAVRVDAAEHQHRTGDWPGGPQVVDAVRQRLRRLKHRIARGFVDRGVIVQDA